MLSKILSAAHFGLKTILIEVEVNISKKGFPGFNIIGLPNKAVEEAKERVKTALVNSGIAFPTAKIVVNLAPADLPKEGSAYDLPIAVGILQAMKIVPLPASPIGGPEGKSFFYGELSLDGSLRHTKGGLLLALAAKQYKVKNLFLPRLSANEASVINRINVYPADSLKELISHLNGHPLIKKLEKTETKDILDEAVIEFDFSEILGQEQAKRALEIAASGGHNIFMQGPPGAGKTMLARALPGILPPLNEEESLEVTKIYSITGNIQPGGSLVKVRPFRTAHHTSSRVGLIGGGGIPHPGEISLAHYGVLFLDELPEFPRSTLETLRQPIEDGIINISRAAGSTKFPAQFMLVAAANPCPCGFLGDPKRECRCSPRQISRYQNRLSGPLMDRIDIHLNVPAVDVDKLTADKNRQKNGEKSETIRKRVERSRKIQEKRLKNSSAGSPRRLASLSRSGQAGWRIFTNAKMRNREVKKFCRLSPQAQLILKQAVSNYHLSARTYFRLIKVARTIADLSAEKEICAAHIAEALQYRIRIKE